MATAINTPYAEWHIRPILHASMAFFQSAMMGYYEITASNPGSNRTARFRLRVVGAGMMRGIPVGGGGGGRTLNRRMPSGTIYSNLLSRDPNQRPLLTAEHLMGDGIVYASNSQFDEGFITEWLLFASPSTGWAQSLITSLLGPSTPWNDIFRQIHNAARNRRVGIPGHVEAVGVLTFWRAGLMVGPSAYKVRYEIDSH